MAKSDFNIEEDNTYDNNTPNNKKGFFSGKAMNNINNPEIVYDENTDNGIFGRITYFFSTINRSILMFFGLIALAVIVGVIVVIAIISGYNKSFKTEITIPDVVYMGETAAVSAISSGTGDVSKTKVTFTNKVYVDPEADEDLPKSDLALELSKEEMTGKEVYNTMIPIEEGAVDISVKASSGTHKMGKAKKTVYVCPRFNSGLVSNGVLSVKVGDIIEKSIDFGPGACSKNITYKSSNTDIFTVTNEGKIEGIKAGLANLIVKRKERTFSIPVYVTSDLVATTELSVSPKKIQIKPGENRRLSVSYLPINANTQKIDYSSANADIAAVDQNGKILGLQEGTTNITVSEMDVEKKEIVEVVVSNLESNTGSTVTDLNLEKESVNLAQGESFKINYYVTPNEAQNKGVTYKSSDEKVVTVNSKGVVFAKGGGEALVSVTTNNSILKTVEVKVESMNKPTVLADDGIIPNNWHNRDYKLKFSGGGYGATYYYGYKKDDLSNRGSEVNLKKEGKTIVYSKACLYNICGPVEETASKLDTKKPNIIKIIKRTDKNTGDNIIYVAAEDEISLVSKWCITKNQNSRNCEWINTSKMKNPVLSRRVNDYGEYFVFVRDGAGNISDAKIVKVDESTDIVNSTLDD